MGAYLGIWKEPTPPDSIEQNLLFQNFPNPFNNNTCITYQIFTRRDAEFVTVKVYNVRGQMIRTLVSEPKTNGVYITYWNGQDELGTGVGSGTYFCQLCVGGSFTTTIKMLWLRPKVEQQPDN